MAHWSDVTEKPSAMCSLEVARTRFMLLGQSSISEARGLNHPIMLICSSAPSSRH